MEDNKLERLLTLFATIAIGVLSPILLGLSAHCVWVLFLIGWRWLR